MKIWSRNIKNYRISSNMTQKNLADKLHVSNTLISKWEKGEREPSIEHIQEMAKLFHVTVDSIMNEDKRVNTDLDIKRNIELFRFNDAKNTKLFLVKLFITVLAVILTLIFKDGKEWIGAVLFIIGIIIIVIELYFLIKPKQFVDSFSVPLDKHVVFEYKGVIVQKKRYKRFALILIFGISNLFTIAIIGFIISQEIENETDQIISIVLSLLLFIGYIVILLLESIVATNKKKISYDKFQYKKQVFMYRFLMILNGIWFYIMYSGLLFYGVDFFITNDTWVLIVLPPLLYIFSNILYIERMDEFEGYELKL